MNFRTLTTGAVLTAALVIGATGIGQAAPVDVPAAAGVGFNVKRVDKTVITSIDKGAFEVTKDAQSVEMKDDSGKTVESWPLSYTLNGMRYPMQYEISGDKHLLKMTPNMDPAKATKITPAQAAAISREAKQKDLPPKADPARPQRVQLKAIASDQENALAQQNFINQLGIGTTAGSLIGTLIGAIVGGVVGAGVALASCAAFLACVVVGIPIFLAFAAAGGIGGTVIAGGGTLIGQGWDYIQTLQAAPGTTPYQVMIDKANAQQAQQLRKATGR